MNKIRFSLKSARVEAGLTQAEAAECLGINRNTLMNYEAYKTSPDMELAQKIADLYHMSVENINFLRP